MIKQGGSGEATAVTSVTPLVAEVSECVVVRDVAVDSVLKEIVGSTTGDVGLASPETVTVRTLDSRTLQK